jgi:hypothetical protein
MRDAGAGIKSADDLLALGSMMDISGQTYAKLKLRRTNEDSGIKGRDSVCRNYALWTIDEIALLFGRVLMLKPRDCPCQPPGVQSGSVQG